MIIVKGDVEKSFLWNMEKTSIKPLVWKESKEKGIYCPTTNGDWYSIKMVDQLYETYDLYLNFYDGNYTFIDDNNNVEDLKKVAEELHKEYVEHLLHILSRFIEVK